ncbi:MAG: tRNA (uridine(34)/cytosine(34)/5-carboxymethylaminomethyluridine(34)-2'-O)-methyltransferase TrmL [Bacillota bacterium]
MEIVLYEPEIPQNTGNIVRLAAATGCGLHLIEPLGFFWNDRNLKRAGLDYWEYARVKRHRSFDHFLTLFPGCRPYYLSTKGTKGYHEVRFTQDDILVFGPETRGLPEKLLATDADHVLRLPMVPGIRCINLSNSVAVVTYEALRQLQFPGMI